MSKQKHDIGYQKRQRAKLAALKAAALRSTKPEYK